MPIDYIDEAYFIDGLPKVNGREAFSANIFLDYEHTHSSDSSGMMPYGRVHYKTNSVLKNSEKDLIVKPKKTEIK